MDGVFDDIGGALLALGPLDIEVIWHMGFSLIKPSIENLPAYAAAVRRGWSWVGQEQLDELGRDPTAFIAQLENPQGIRTLTLPDGSSVPRLPSLQRWLWDGEFCGLVDFRWQRGTPALPPTCLGHVGFAVVPWKQNRGYAKQALALLLPDIRAQGLPYIELTAVPENVASQRVILSNGGELIERFTKTSANGGGESLRFRITL